MLPSGLVGDVAWMSYEGSAVQGNGLTTEILICVCAAAELLQCSFPSCFL